MGVKFCPIASGSNGNCIYIGSDSTKILIDAGVSGKKIENRLSEIGVDASKIDGIFLTHEHEDHIQGAGILSRRFDIPIYTTENTWEYINRNKCIGKVVDKNKVVIYKNEKVVINDLVIKPFEIPHDSSEPVAYTVLLDNYKLAVATDIGHVTNELIENLLDTDVLLIESNHDIEMLKNGRYPDYLKNRILGNNGHLSNVSTGQALSKIISKRLKHVFLGHLSEKNNHPLIALNTVTSILEANNIKVGNDLNLHVACRESVSQALVL